MLEDAYFRERVRNIRNIGCRVVDILLGISETIIIALPLVSMPLIDCD